MTEKRVSKDPSIFNEQAIQNHDNTIVLYGEHQKRDVNRLLAMKIKDTNGKLNSMFAIVEDNGSQRYCCLLCSKRDMGVLKLISHAGSKTHKLKLNATLIPRIGSNDEVPSEIQARLNKITDQVLIGVEYVIELTFGETFEPIFHCVLCEGRFDLQVVIHHLTSYVHRLKYFEKHFETVFKKISRMEKREQKYQFLEKVCQSIEDHYGRLSMTVVRGDEFSTNQATFYDRILYAKHFDEQMGQTFAELIDINQNYELSPISESDETGSMCGLESISTSSEFQVSPVKASGKILLSSSSPFSPDEKLSLSPISSERTPEFDKSFRSDESSLQLSSNDDKLAICERTKQINETSDTFGKKYSNIRKSNSVKYAGKNGKSESTDRKTSNKIERKSQNLKYYRKRDDQPDAGVNQNRDRSRSPQDRQTYVRNYRKNSREYRKMKTDNNFHSYGRSRPSYGRTNRSNSLSSYDRDYNRPTETMTGPGSCKGYKLIPISIDPDIDVKEFSLCRRDRERTNLWKHSSGGHNHPTETNEPDINDGEPITIISVLSLLSAFENYLGSLGPKVIELMTEALAMENISVNFSNRILDDMTHFILFDATKEKLKGLLNAGIVEEKKRMAFHRTIKQMDALIGEANARKRLKMSSSKIFNHRTESNDLKSAVADKILVAMYERGRANISKVELAQYVDQYISLANDGQDYNREIKSETQEVMDDQPIDKVDSINSKNQELRIAAVTDSSVFEAFPSTTLSDSNLATLTKNFAILSDMEKQEVISIVRNIGFSEPERMQRLRNQMQIDKLLNFKF